MFIDELKLAAEKFGLQDFCRYLCRVLADGRTQSVRITKLNNLPEDTVVYMLYEDGEFAIIMTDHIRGDSEEKYYELPDEEAYSDEGPMWFTEDSYRLSPFFRLMEFTTAFQASLGAKIANSSRFFSILISDTSIFDEEEFKESLKRLNGTMICDFENWGHIEDLKTYNTQPVAKGYFKKFIRRWNKNFDSITIPMDNYPDKPEFGLPVYDIDDYDDYKGGAEDTSESDVDEEGTKENTDVPTEDVDINEGLDELLQRFVANEASSEEDTKADNLNGENAPDSPEPPDDTGQEVIMQNDPDMPPVKVLSAISNPFPVLDAMVGLKELKQYMLEAVDYAKFTDKVRCMLPRNTSLKINLHAIVEGRPGTGKSTVCQIYSSLLHKAGLLSRGHTVVATRSSFIGEHFGTEEVRMRQILKVAEGGCLFIDECGDIFAGPHPHDPGKGVLQLLLQMLADESHRDIAVVLALYDDRSLTQLYELNPGIKSRFLNVFKFPDYTFPELREILKRRTKAMGFSFTPTAWHKISDRLAELYTARDKNFGNAREVVNILQRCIVKHAVRCEKAGLDGDKLVKITAADIPDVAALLPVRKFGFAN